MDDLVQAASSAGFETKENMIWVDGWEITPTLRRFAQLVAKQAVEAERAKQPTNWSVYNSGAEVASGLSFEEAWEQVQPTKESNMSREVMQQALDALKSIEWHGSGSCWVMDVEKVESAEAALREALAQPEQEPTQANSDEVICPACCHQFRAIPVNVQQLMLDAGFEPPFTTPPAAQKPLTDEQITKCYEAAGHCLTLRPQDKFVVFAFARAIEAAHGITSD